MPLSPRPARLQSVSQCPFPQHLISLPDRSRRVTLRSRRRSVTQPVAGIAYNCALQKAKTSERLGRPMKNRLLGTILLGLGLAISMSSPARGQSAEGRLMRFPDISGHQIAFSYGGDLWLVSRQG